MTVTTINVTDMHCSACTNKIRSALQQLGEVRELQFNPVKRQVFVTHDNALSNTRLLTQIEQVGFAPQLVADTRLEQQADKALLKRLGVAGIGMMQVMMVQIALYAGAFQGIDESIRRLLEYTALLFCIPVVTYSAVPFFSSALASVRKGLNMDAPIALAIAIAFTTSLVSTLRGVGEVYYDSVVMFSFLMLGARFWEARIRHRLSIEDSLQAALPRSVTRIEAGRHIETSIDQIQPGDHLWIAEGAQVPADGMLDTDHARLEEAWLTGESDWRMARRGERVFAGTLNRGAGFTLQVMARPADSRIAQIDELANTAMDSKHNLARLADRVARVFIPSILTIATVTFGAWWLIDPANAFPAALAVLVVSCPCALSLATPAALTAALTRLRQAGVLVKNSRALEQVSNLRDVYFDKTGTLTNPEACVVKRSFVGNHTDQQCWDYACSLQAHSAHPLARAFATTKPQSARHVQLHTGKGLRGELDGHEVRIGSAQFCGFVSADPQSDQADGKSVYLAIDNVPAAVYTVASDVRADAASTVAALKDSGLGVHMLSGDNDANCAPLAAQLDVHYHASATPESKPRVLAGDSDKSSVLYVGDGVNDLPALAGAGISATTVETADLVKSKADVLLLRKGLSGLIGFVRVGRRSRTIMSENLLWALAYNLLAIPLAAMGYVPPWGAALGMSASSLLVMLNSTRLLRVAVED